MMITGTALLSAAMRTAPNTTYSSPSRKNVNAIRTCRPVSLPKEVGLGIS
jgi:hypothetical protein